MTVVRVDNELKQEDRFDYEPSQHPVLDTPPPPLDPNEGAQGASCFRLDCQPTVDWTGPKDVHGFPLEIAVTKLHQEATFCTAEDCQSGNNTYVVAAP